LLVTCGPSADLLGPPTSAAVGAATISCRRALEFSQKPTQIQRRINRLVSGIAAASTAVRDAVVAGEGYPSDRIRIIPNGVDTASFSPQPEEPRAKVRAALGLPPDALVIGTLARLDAAKGLDLLFDAALHLLAHRAASAPPLRFLFVGGGPLQGE